MKGYEDFQDFAAVLTYGRGRALREYKESKDENEDGIPVTECFAQCLNGETFKIKLQHEGQGALSYDLLLEVKIDGEDLEGQIHGRNQGKRIMYESFQAEDMTGRMKLFPMKFYMQQLSDNPNEVDVDDDEAGELGIIELKVTTGEIKGDPNAMDGGEESDDSGDGEWLPKGRRVKNPFAKRKVFGRRKKRTAEELMTTTLQRKTLTENKKNKMLSTVILGKPKDMGASGSSGGGLEFITPEWSTHHIFRWRYYTEAKLIMMGVIKPEDRGMNHGNKRKAAPSELDAKEDKKPIVTPPPTPGPSTRASSSSNTLVGDNDDDDGIEYIDPEVMKKRRRARIEVVDITGSDDEE